MKIKPIIIVPGQQKSIFFEIFFKSLKLYKSKSPLILITSSKLIISKMKKYNFKKNLRILNINDLQKSYLNNRVINIINVNLDTLNAKKTLPDNLHVLECFKTAFKLLKSGFTDKFINGPINKNQILKKKFLGVSEFISNHFKIKNMAMLIYNKDLSVCPLTTHLPLRLVSKKISKKLIISKVDLIDNFYKKNLGFRPKIAVTGLNPHCESVLNFNEDEKIISPSIKILKKRGYKIYGPFPADTVFLKQNRKKFNVILGMYHDQVLTPIKTLKEYDAINITLGLPFYRVSPDHGPNEKMINKKLSNPLSITKAIKFLDQR